MTKAERRAAASAPKTAADVALSWLKAGIVSKAGDAAARLQSSDFGLGLPAADATQAAEEAWYRFQAFTQAAADLERREAPIRADYERLVAAGREKYVVGYDEDGAEVFGSRWTEAGREACVAGGYVFPDGRVPNTVAEFFAIKGV